MSDFVYVIRAVGGPVKIGVAASPEHRCKTMATACPFPLEMAFKYHVEGTNPHKVERAAHRLLFDRRACGEWFNVSVDEAIQAIEKAAGQITNPPSIEDEPMRTRTLISAAQSRAARALLNLGLAEVSKAAGLAVNTIARFEKDDTRRISMDTALKIAAAYHELGIEFLDDDGVRRTQEAWDRIRQEKAA
jgi:DNA-binding XRE family transcriptional regulator